jgi:hypothetical protein
MVHKPKRSEMKGPKGYAKDKTETIHIRVTSLVKQNAMRRAELSGTTVSAVLRWQLAMYASGHEYRWTPERPKHKWWEYLEDLQEDEA